MRILRAEEVTAEDFKNLTWRKLTPEELKDAYALAKASFTAADLQQFTELDEGIPAEEVLKELEELQRQYDEQNKQ
jgi:anion-transporting  ArsA/GET3 family ATPase